MISVPSLCYVMLQLILISLSFTMSLPELFYISLLSPVPMYSRHHSSNHHVCSIFNRRKILHCHHCMLWYFLKPKSSLSYASQNQVGQVVPCITLSSTRSCLHGGDCLLSMWILTFRLHVLKVETRWPIYPW